MTTILRLHYAPDNASGIIRLALEELGLPYETVLVDRRVGAQKSAAYRALNPAAKIPALETSEGVIFETAAILLWLADRTGQLAPAPGDPQRGRFLSWLFYLSNTLHANLRMTFYPQKYVGDDPAAHPPLLVATRAQLTETLRILEDHAASGDDWFNNPQTVSALDLYLCPMLRWMGLYPLGDTDWFALRDFPKLHALAARMEARASAQALATAEGMGPALFTDPHPPCPPEGVAL